VTNEQENKKFSGPRMNNMIIVKEIRLITEEGDNIGVVLTRDALERAKRVSLDLVEIVPNAEPPVCKIMDYGKFRYQEQKKHSEGKKKQKVVELKEIKTLFNRGKQGQSNITVSWAGNCPCKFRTPSHAKTA
jgi:translation initiation factor IF-3